MKHQRFLRYMLLTLLVSMLGIGRASAVKRAYVQYDGRVTLTFHYDDGFYNYEKGNTYLISGKGTPWIFDQTKMNVEKVVFDDSFRDYRPTSTAGWFKNLIRLSSTEGMRDNLITSEVTDMSDMFYNNAFRSLDLTTFPNFVTSKVEDMSAYDVVFVGFPVWWYREPSIIDTFMESYDLSGKTVVPFATSGTSPIGSSGANMQRLAPGAKVAEGKRFSARVEEAELAEWAAEWL